ncbi:hypothetical protein J6590_052578 [Homalodisca vitripennis]|nr:hypothetical protein J6590_052578 [Homalodisca vitripennis]
MKLCPAYGHIYYRIHGNESIRVSVPTPRLGGRGSRIAGPHDSAHTPRPVCPFPPIAPPAPLLTSLSRNPSPRPNSLSIVCLPIENNLKQLI